MITKAVAVLAAVSGLAADEVENTFWFTHPDTEALAHVTAIATAITQFYTNSGATSHSVAEYISPVMSRALGAAIVKCYTGPDINGVTGSPVLNLPFTLNAADSPFPQLPREVALAMSFHGDLSPVPEEGAVAAIPSSESAIDQGAPATHSGHTRPRARRRGRIFLGPLATSALRVTSGTAEQRPHQTVIDTLATAAGQLHTGTMVTAGEVWIVGSRRDNIGYPVTGGWVDDEFDTQRRRQIKPTARTVTT